MDNSSLSDRLRPVDMVGAGLFPSITAPAPQAPTSGNIPKEAAAAIQTPPPPPAPMPQLPLPPVTTPGIGLLDPQYFIQQPMTPGQTLAASFAGGVSAMRGHRNPVLDQFAEQQDARRQAVQTAQSWLDTARKRKQENDESRLRIASAFRDSENPQAQAFYANEMTRWARSNGVAASPEWFAETNKLGEKDIKDINDLVYANVPDAEIMARYPKASPQWLATQRQMLANPQVAEKLGYKRPEDPILAAQEAEAKRVKSWLDANPEFKKADGALYNLASQRFQQLTGRHITTATKEDSELLQQVYQQADKVLEDKEAARKAQEAADKRKAQSEDRYQQGLDKPIPVPAGAQVYDKKTKQMYSYGVVSQGDIKSDPTRYKVIAHSEAQLLDFLDTTGPQLDLLAKATKQLLAINPGANLARQLELAAKGKLAMSPELTAFFQANADLALEMARALSGGGQLRVTVLKYLREDVIPTTSDSVATANTKINLMRQQLENRRRGILGEKVGPLSVEPGNPSAPKAGAKFDKPRRVRDPKTGKTGTLPAGTPLPDGVEVIP